MTAGGWRAREVVREAVGHLCGATVRSVLVGVMLAGGFGVLVWAELAVTGRLLADVERFRARGAHVMVATVETGERISAHGCEALGRLPGVLGAGAARGGSQLVFESAPGGTYQRVEVTPGVIGVWDPGAPVPDGGGWVLGGAAARELGVTTGSLLVATGTSPRAVTVVEPGERNEFGTRWVMDLVPATGEADACWVEFAPGTAAAGRTALAAALAPAQVVVRPALAVSGEFSRDPVAEFSGREQRWAWLPVGALLVLLLTTVTWLRRSEVAVYRAFGLPRTGVLFLRQVETLVAALAAFAIGASWAVALYAVTIDVPAAGQVAVALRTAAKALLTTVAAAPVLGALVARGDPAALLRERG